MAAKLKRVRKGVYESAPAPRKVDSARVRQIFERVFVVPKRRDAEKTTEEHQNSNSVAVEVP